MSLQTKAQGLLKNNLFNGFILFAIALNGLLIGWQTYDNCPAFVRYVQLGLLSVFFVEIAIRWIGRNSTQEYLADPWNYFDVFVLVAGVLPEVLDIFIASPGQESQSSIIAMLRLLRVVQLSRSIRAINELRILVKVMVRSLRSLAYVGGLFLLVMYIYAIVGVTLFKNRDYQNSENLQMTANNPDPWGDVGEGFFTLFRVITGDDWSDLRYNAIDNEHTSRDDGAKSRPQVSNTLITFFYISWIVTAGYLLLSLGVGAVVTNFQRVLADTKEEIEP